MITVFLHHFYGPSIVDRCLNLFSKNKLLVIIHRSNFQFEFYSHFSLFILWTSILKIKCTYQFKKLVNFLSGRDGRDGRG